MCSICEADGTRHPHRLVCILFHCLKDALQAGRVGASSALVWHLTAVVADVVASSALRASQGHMHQVRGDHLQLILGHVDSMVIASPWDTCVVTLLWNDGHASQQDALFRGGK